jgi:hypothetical protein
MFRFRSYKKFLIIFFSICIIFLFYDFAGIGDYYFDFNKNNNLKIINDDTNRNDKVEYNNVRIKFYLLALFMLNVLVMNNYMLQRLNYTVF